jgi:hypothetical protein
VAPHPLAELISAAAAGRFPPVDGGWHRVPPWRPGLHAVIAFTGHAVLALPDDVPDRTLNTFGVDGFGGAHDPRLIAALAGPDGWIDSLDLIVGTIGVGPTLTSEPTSAPMSEPVSAPVPASVAVSAPGLVQRPDLAEHPRARHAASIRSRPVVFGYPEPGTRTVAILSEGIAGLTELSFELDPGQRGAGRGTALIHAALHLVPAGQLVVSSVAPGNTASLRSLLSAGFVPLASLQLFSPR